MKHLATLLAALLTAAAVSAQTPGLLILKNGQSLAVYNIEPGASNLFYTEEPAADAAMKRLPRSEVFALKIGDGALTQLDEAAAPAAPETAPTSAEQPAAPGESKPTVTQAVAAADNAAICAAYSAEAYGYVPLKKTEKHRGKGGSECALLFYRVSENSVLSTDEVEITFEAGYWDLHQKRWIGLSEALAGPHAEQSAQYTTIRIGVRNKTDRTLYLDLTRCARNSEITGYRAYYDGTQTVESTGKATHGGIGLGMIGIGGTSTSTTTVVKSQASTLILPPKSRVFLPSQQKLGPVTKQLCESYDFFGNIDEVLPFVETLPELRNYEPVLFTEGDSPASIQLTVVYSSDASFERSTISNIRLYVSEMIPLHASFNIWAGGMEDDLKHVPGANDKTLVGEILLIKK